MANAFRDRGLARVSAPSDTLVLYATRPGETASDNPSGRNGLFTKHLLTVMDTPGTEVEDALKQVAREVYRDSGLSIASAVSRAARPASCRPKPQCCVTHNWTDTGGRFTGIRQPPFENASGKPTFVGHRHFRIS